MSVGFHPLLARRDGPRPHERRAGRPSPDAPPLLRVLLLLDSAFPYDGGGRETGMYHIAKFGQGQIEMRAITLGRPQNVSAAHYPDAADYCAFHPTVTLRGRFAFRGYDKISRFLDNVLFPLQAHRKARGVLHGWRPDAFLCVHAGPLSLVAIDLARRIGCLSVLNMRSFYSDELERVSPLHRPFLGLFRLVERKVIRDVDLVLANGEDTDRACRERYRRVKPTVLVHNGVDTTLFAPSDQADLRRRLGLEGKIVFVSNNPTRAIKGPQELIAAFARLPADLRPDCRVMLFGAAREFEPFRALARGLAIENLILWLPPVRHEELPAYLAAADIAVHPVLFSAGTTHASLECLACGLPQVSYDAASLRTTCIDGETGVLVPAGEVGALADAMTRLARDDGLRLRYGEAARARAMDFDWAKYVVRYVDAVRRNCIV